MKTAFEKKYSKIIKYANLVEKTTKPKYFISFQNVPEIDFNIESTTVGNKNNDELYGFYALPIKKKWKNIQNFFGDDDIFFFQRKYIFIVSLKNNANVLYLSNLNNPRKEWKNFIENSKTCFSYSKICFTKYMKKNKKLDVVVDDVGYIMNPEPYEKYQAVFLNNHSMEIIDIIENDLEQYDYYLMYKDIPENFFFVLSRCLEYFNFCSVKKMLGVIYDDETVERIIKFLIFLKKNYPELYNTMFLSGKNILYELEKIVSNKHDM